MKGWLTPEHTHSCVSPMHFHIVLFCKTHRNAKKEVQALIFQNAPNHIVLGCRMCLGCYSQFIVTCILLQKSACSPAVWETCLECNFLDAPSFGINRPWNFNTICGNKESLYSFKNEWGNSLNCEDIRNAVK